MKTFYLYRKKDISGNSGTGYVAEGCIFHNGYTAMTWYGNISSFCWYTSLSDLVALHGHDGCTEVHYDKKLDIDKVQ